MHQICFRIRPLARRGVLLATLALGSLMLMGCGDDDEVSNERDARNAYLGLDAAVDRMLQLGFDGFNAASSANIPEQQGDGDLSGTMAVNGQVDQGNSNNKGMRLDVSLTDYSDGPVEFEDEDPVDITYNTSTPIDADLSFKGLPDADMTGTIVGTVQMTGDLLGDVTLNLSVTGLTEDDGTGLIQRAAGTVRVTGTATSEFGVYDVDVTR